jgi:hypothetical protein
MYNVSSGFKAAIKQSSRIVAAKISINSNTYLDDKIINLSFEDSSNPSNKFELGAVAAAKVDLSLTGVNEVFETATFKPFIGLDVNGSIEWVPLGVFYADDVDRKKDVTKLTLFDGMIKLEQAYFSNLSYPATITSVINEICSKTGMQFVGSLPAYMIAKPEGYKYREAVGFIATLCGGFAKFNRDGKLTIKSYAVVTETISPDHYIDYKKKKDRPYRIDKVTCQVGETILSKGSLKASGSEITFENPFMTDAILTDVFNNLNGFEYLPAWFKAQGNPALECGDIITLNTTDNEIIKVPVMKHKISYQGGLIMEIDSEGESENSNQFNSSGSVTQKVDRVIYEQALINSALINKANIVDLIATNARIDNLKVTTAMIEDASITTAKIKDAQITSAKIVDASITSAKIGDAQITTAKIALGAITTALLGTAVVDTAQIKDLAITDAKIVSLAATKITAGTIDTGQVTVQGAGGKLKITGNRVQVFDKQPTPIERVAMGDVNGDGSVYGFLMRGADGVTVLMDINGVKSAGITDGAITNPKIGDGAVKNTNIFANTITGDRLVADAITAREIKTASISANEMVANTITAASGIIADAAIVTAKIANLAVTGAKIANLAVGTAHIADAAITSAKIGSIDAGKITTGTLKAITIDGVTINSSLFHGQNNFQGPLYYTRQSIDISNAQFVGKVSYDAHPTNEYVQTTVGPDVIQIIRNRRNVAAQETYIADRTVELYARDSISGNIQNSLKLQVASSLASIAASDELNMYANAIKVRAGKLAVIGGWLYTSDNTGWYNDTYDGGWYMSDSTWVRSYANKSIYTDGWIRAGNFSMRNGDFIKENYAGFSLQWPDGYNFYFETAGTLGLILRNNAVRMVFHTNGPTARIESVSGTAANLVVATVNGSSDRELKKNIVDYETSALYEINTTPIRNYQFKEEIENIDRPRVGIIMQEAPIDVVDPRGQGVDLYAMIAMSWKAIQELSDKIDKLAA